MRQISKRQQSKNLTLSKIKKSLIDESGYVCRICGNYGNDLMHLLPKSIFPEYYTESRNLIIGCRSCHDLFDNDLSFRKQQTSLISQCREYALECDVNRYFDL